MAHIGIVSAAYWGDVMPYVPIADELVRRGHRVTFALPEGFHETLRHHAFDLVHLGTHFSPRELEAYGHIIEKSNTVRGIRAATDLWLKQMCIDPAEEILAVLHGIAPDVWVTANPAAWLTQLHAEPTGTPHVAGHLFPMMIPSAHQTPPMLPIPQGAPSFVNRLGWKLGRAMVSRMMFDDEVNELRRARGLAPEHANTGFGWERTDRVVVLVSETYWPRPPDLSDHIVFTGFTVWGNEEDELPDDLRRYLDEGDPPVLVTLGTSAASNARDAFDLCAAAAEQVGDRVIMLVGNERNHAALGRRDDAWVFAPLPAVLPHCKAVVHAAGHGTIAAALHAGVPQVVLPQTFDQNVHAPRLAELGVAEVVPWKRRSAKRVAEALVALDSDTVRASARAIADTLAVEDGPARAAEQIEAVLS